jgi:ankyrin repeat protein
VKPKVTIGLAGIGAGVGLLVLGEFLGDTDQDFPFYLGIMGVVLISATVLFLFLAPGDERAAARNQPPGERQESSRRPAPRLPVPAAPSPQGISGAPSPRIHPAALDGDLERVKALLDAGTDVNAKDNGGQTPLHWAACGGHKTVVELLLARGANVNARDSGRGTPLHDAAGNGHREVVQLLLTKGAEPEARDDEGLTPAAAAVRNGHREVAELLLASAAKAESANRAAGQAHAPPASKDGQGAGAEPPQAKPTGPQPLPAGRTEAKAHAGQAPPPEPAPAGQTEPVKLEPAPRAEAAPGSEVSPTPREPGPVPGERPPEESLPEPGLKVDVHAAAAAGDLAQVEALLKNHPDLAFRRNDRGLTPLHSAASQGRRGVAELLLASQAEVNGRDDNGWTPLHWAAIYGHKEIAELLLANHADVNARESNGWTPLHWAAGKGRKDVAELLRLHGGRE